MSVYCVRNKPLANTTHQSADLTSVIQNVTSFVEDGAVRSTDKLHLEHSTPVGAANSFTSSDISAALARPNIIQNFIWNSSDPILTQLLNVEIGRELKTNDFWFQKIKGFAFVRATAVLRLQINAQPFQQGRLILHQLPLLESFQNPLQMQTLHNGSLTQITQHPNVEIDCRDSSGVLRIPYVSPANWYDWNGEVFDWGRIYVHVLSRLVSATATDVDCTLWLSFEDAEISTPVMPQAGQAVKVRKQAYRSFGRSEATDMNEGPISKSLSKVAATAAMWEDVPVLSSFMQPLAWMSDLMAQTLNVWGWSKPIMESPPQYNVLRNLPYFGNSDGVSPSASLGMISVPRVDVLPGFAGTEVDEMSFDYLKRIPAYIGAFSYDIGSPPDAVLYEVDLTPNELCSTLSRISGTNRIDARVYPPFAYLSNLFAYYRGSIEMTLKFIKTDYHTGRVVVTYYPYFSNSPSPVADTTYLLREIIDLKTSSEITLKFPYLVNVPYYSTSKPYGKVVVQVLNEIRCPPTVTQGVSVLVYFAGGQDFEIQVPATTQVPQVDAVQELPVYMQMDVNQDTMLTNKPIGDTVVPSLSLDNSRYCIGEHFKSVKQLLSRKQPMFILRLSTYSAFLRIWPWMVNIFTWVPPGAQYTLSSNDFDVHSYILPGFLLGRGSVRLTYKANNKVEGIRAQMQFRDYSLAVSATNQVDTLPGSMLTSVTDIGASFPFVGPTLAPIMEFAYDGPSTNVIDVELPFYSKTHSFLMNWGTVDGTPIPHGDVSQPITSVIFNEVAAQADRPPNIYRSFGDDFQVGMFIGFPPLCYFAN